MSKRRLCARAVACSAFATSPCAFAQDSGDSVMNRSIELCEWPTDARYIAAQRANLQRPTDFTWRRGDHGRFNTSLHSLDLYARWIQVIPNVHEVMLAKAPPGVMGDHPFADPCDAESSVDQCEQRNNAEPFA